MALTFAASMKRVALLLILTMAAGCAWATRDQVMAKCGNPANVVRSTQFVQSVAWVNGVPVAAGNALIEVPVESWLYNFGPTKLMRRVIFESGRVVAIETLGYGYNSDNG